MTQLTFQDHSRIFAKFTYIYPVVSRRSQGISLGINLNVNNACNWRCVYCQVEGLARGKPETIDLDKLKFELDYMLNWLTNGDFVVKYASSGLQRFNDICLSGNGESTMSKDFLSVMNIIYELRNKYNITNAVKTILITNGSEVDRPDILAALKLMATCNGEIWFKIDSATVSGIEKINQAHLNLPGIIKRLKLAAELCPTYIQTCLFRLYNQDPNKEDIRQYVDLIGEIKEYISGVFIYSTARNPALPEGAHISQVSEDFLANVADQLNAYGVSNVKYYV